MEPKPPIVPIVPGRPVQPAAPIPPAPPPRSATACSEARHVHRPSFWSSSRWRVSPRSVVVGLGVRLLGARRGHLRLAAQPPAFLLRLPSPRRHHRRTSRSLVPGLPAEAAAHIGLAAATPAQFRGFDAYALFVSSGGLGWAIKGTPAAVVPKVLGDLTYSKTASVLFLSGGYVLYFPDLTDMPEAFNLHVGLAPRNVCHRHRSLPPCTTTTTNSATGTTATTGTRSTVRHLC